MEKNQSFGTGRGGDFFVDFYFYDVSGVEDLRRKPVSRAEWVTAGLSESLFDEYLGYINRLYGSALISKEEVWSPETKVNFWGALGMDRGLLEDFSRFCVSSGLTREYKTVSGKLLPVIDPMEFEDFPFLIQYPECPDAVELVTVDQFRLQVEYRLADLDIRWYLHLRYGVYVAEIEGKEQPARFSWMDPRPVPLTRQELREVVGRIREDQQALEAREQQLKENPPRTGNGMWWEPGYEARKEWITGRRNTERELDAVSRCLENLPDLTDTDEETLTAEEPEDDTLYICRGNILCRQAGHRIEQATAVLKDLNGREILLNVNHCLDCSRFFMDYGVYQRYRERYGVILGNLRFVSSGSLEGPDTQEWAEESPLHLCGYSVSQAAGLSPEERQSIIAACIESGAMTKASVIRLLQRFIDVNGARERNRQAVHKWCEDLDFALAYNTPKQNRYAIGRIVKYTRNQYRTGKN